MVEKEIDPEQRCSESDLKMSLLWLFRYLFGKLVRFERGGTAKHCISGVLPFSGFMLKDQPPPSQVESSGTLPQPATNHSHPQVPPNTRENPPKRATKRTSHSRRPKFAPRSDVVKRRSLHSEKRPRVLLEASDQSNGEWSDSEGELVIDTPSGGPLSGKKEGSKRRRETAEVPSSKKSLVDEEVCADGEGGCGNGCGLGNIERFRIKGFCLMIILLLDEELELAMRSGKVRRLHPIPLKHDGEIVTEFKVQSTKIPTILTS